VQKDLSIKWKGRAYFHPLSKGAELQLIPS
jgi:hypothetical protein